jgi:MFS family permease
MVSMQNKSHLSVIFITVFLYLVGFGVMIPIMPMIGREYGASPFQIGLLMSSYSFMQFIFAPFWGRLSDGYGRRKILLSCLAGEVICYLMLGLAQSLTGLFIARALAGFFGASISTASASISDITPKKERSKGMALIGAAFGLGFVVGPSLGGLFALTGENLFPQRGHLFGMQFASFGVSFICLITFIFAWFNLKETVHLSRLSSDSTRLNSNPTKGRLATLGRFLRTPVTGPLIGNFFLNSFAMSIMEATLILFAADRFGWGIKEVSFGFAYIGLLSAANQGFLVRRLLPIYGEKNIMLTGFVAQIASYLLISQAQSVSILALAMTLLSLGNGFVNPSLLGSISLTTKSDEQGEALGTAQGTASLGRILGPALGGYLYANLSLSSPFFVSALLVFVSFLISLKIRKSLPNSAQVLSQEQEIDQIGAFQFSNLVYGQVNFILLHDGINFSEAFSGLELQFLSRISIVIDFNANESEWLEKIQKASIPEHMPVVIFRGKAPLSIKSALRFKKLYKGNVCLVTQSWEALKRELIKSESSL